MINPLLNDTSFESREHAELIAKINEIIFVLTIIEKVIVFPRMDEEVKAEWNRVMGKIGAGEFDRRKA